MRDTPYELGSLHDDSVRPLDEGYEDSRVAKFRSPLS